MQIDNFLERLTQRERFLLLGLAVSVSLLVTFFVIRQVVLMRMQVHEDALLAIEDASAIVRLRSDILALPVHSALPDMNQFIAQTSSLLEKHSISASDIRNRTESVSRGEEALVIEISVNGSGLRSIMNFIYDIEMNRAVPATVALVNLRRSLPEKEVYDAKLTLSIRKPVGKGD